MGKQKQQTISRFFASKPKSPSPSPPPPPPEASIIPLNQNPPTPPPKVSATVSFSPSKRKILSDQLALSSPKKPKLSSHTHNPVPDPSLHQRFLQKFLEPSLSVPETSNQPPAKHTPLEQQVVELKSKHPDVLLMVEVGYKYRFFGEDAEIAARVLGIYAHMDHNFMTASVPTFRLNVHVRRLVSAGYKVGVVKQTETAAIKAHGSNRLGPFSRDLNALYTKATLEAAQEVGGGEEGCGGESNYLACVVENKIVMENKDCGFEVKIGITAVEISTGDVVHGEFKDNFMRSGLEAVILSLSPAELLIEEPISKQTEKLLLAYAGPASNVRVERVSRDNLRNGGALAEIMSLYENIDSNNPVDNQKRDSKVAEREDNGSAIQGILDMADLAVQAFALSIRHLKQFGFERIVCLGATFRSLSSNLEMTLSGNALQQLEVLRNNSNGSEFGSLLHTMNHTCTIYGSRLLRHWVTHPLFDRNLISARLDAVSELSESMGSSQPPQAVTGCDEEEYDATIIKTQFYHVVSSVLTDLARSPDIQRGITRIFHRTATASEFIAVIQAILCAGKQLQRLHMDEEFDEVSPMIHSPLLKKMILTASSSNVVSNAAKLLHAVNKDAADEGDVSNLIITSSGQFLELARARIAVKMAKEKLNSLICLYRKQLGMHNLEFLSVSGTTHLIELPTIAKVPLNWIRVNSTKKSIRYHPPEVLASLDELSLASEELAHVSRVAWDSFLTGFSEYYAEFQAAVQALAALDCLHGFATLSRNKNYVRPLLVNEDEPVQIHISCGRHPVLETILQDNFVPNETNLHADGEFCQIVTGPNMGGKSCYIRQVALISIMAQVGSFVPAASAKLHVLDGIYTRMGASDSIQRGRSTFLEELSEASDILRNCSSRSLVIIDELGRGTSTHDGVAIAYATLHYLLEHKKCMTLFVTHYPELADIKTEFPSSVGTYHVSYLTSHTDTHTNDSKPENEDVTYLYKLVHGASERSFGFKVAQLAQLPISCIRRAISMSARLEAIVSSKVRSRSEKRRLLEIQSSDQEPEGQENQLEYHESFLPGKLEMLTELNSAYRDFFMNLKFALTHNNNHVESLQFLKHARIIAKEILRGMQKETYV